MKAAQLALGIVFLVPAALFAGGFAHDDNFIVYAPDQPLADQVLAKAETYRQELAKELLGKELPARAGRTIITVDVSTTKDSGFTWPIDHPDRRFHNTWLTTSRERAVGSTLRHEICHVVLNTQFPQALPTWVEEGLASRNDDATRLRSGRQIIASMAQGGWSGLGGLLDARTIGSADQTSYAMATSLTEYLLSQGDVGKLLQFAADGKGGNWDGAVQQHYGSRGVADLEAKWHAWAAAGTQHASAATWPREYR